jgi:polyhydroxybutyrate depolymerase
MPFPRPSPRRRRRRALAAGALLLAAHCGGASSATDATAGDGSPPSDGQSPRPQPDAAATPDGGAPRDSGGPGVDGGTSSSPGCGHPATGPAVSTVRLTVGGVARTFVLSIPAGYNATTPYAFVVAFHGRSGNGTGLRSYIDMERVTGGQALFAYPDGVPRDGTDTGWDESASGPDMAFVDALVAHVAGNYCVNPRGVFAVGFSWGGWMSNAVGCARGDVFRAVTSAEGGGPRGTCRGAEGAIVVHDQRDPAEPYASGVASRDFWLRSNTCGTTTTPVAAPAGNPCVAYQGCRAGGPVIFCSPNMGSHEFGGFTSVVSWNLFRSLL